MSLVCPPLIHMPASPNPQSPFLPVAFVVQLSALLSLPPDHSCRESGRDLIIRSLSVLFKQPQSPTSTRTVTMAERETLLCQVGDRSHLMLFLFYNQPSLHLLILADHLCLARRWFGNPNDQNLIQFFSFYLVG